MRRLLVRLSFSRRTEPPVMPLADHLTEDAICVTVRANRRDEALRQLLERLVAAGALPGDDVDAALNVLIERELLGSTAIGNGVAVPHARMEGLSGLHIAFGLCPEGVNFKALDGAPVTQVFVVLGPKDGPGEYLDAMARITKLVQNGDFRRFVSRASDAGEVLDLIREMDA
jgi:mannitol/fructose-specific phosphotransferase system IIA component (Ntr-type)